MMKTQGGPIVCGTDLSAPATEAVNAAAAIARRLESPLILAHVVEDDASLIANATVHQLLMQRKREATVGLGADVARLQELGTRAEERLLIGTVHESLVDLATETRARLLVIGAFGHGVGHRLLLGSVAERTAETAPVPTIVVRPGSQLREWADGERALKIFVGADFTASGDAALRWVAELRQAGAVEVVVGYVDWPPEEAARLGVSGPLGLQGNLPAMQSVLERDLQEKVTRLLGGENVRISARGNWGRADMPLVEMAIEAQADLIVVGTHQRHGLDRLRHGSVSRGILHHAPMSVACVPAPAAAPMAGPRIRECKRVLVAVDLNEPHGFAAPHGYSIVQPGGTVRLVHNVVPFRLPTPMIGGYWQDSPSAQEHAQLVAESEAKLRALAPPEADARGIVTEVEVTESRDTAKAICAAAERFGADVTCVGSHTRPGFTAKVLGSVSLAVLQSSRRPVLIVWPPAP